MSNKIEAGNVVQRTGCDTDLTSTGNLYLVRSVDHREGKLTLEGINYPSTGDPVVYGINNFTKRMKANTSTTYRSNAPRKFWMVASDTPGNHFSQDKFKAFGGAPHKKYYDKDKATQAILNMVNPGRSYYLLESVEHHAPATTITIKSVL